MKITFLTINRILTQIYAAMLTLYRSIRWKKRVKRIFWTAINNSKFNFLAMKRVILVAGLILAVSLASYARKFVAEGKTYSAMGNYKIEIDDNYVMLNGKEHRPYVITYENSDLVVRVAVDMEKGCKKYYVISDNLSIQYVSNRRYFGVEKLAPEIEKDGYKTSDAALNRAEFFHQKVLTSGQSWRRNNTKLIAAYYPMLLNNVGDFLAAK